MKTWDAIIIGGGIIGLSLAIELRKKSMRVLIVERGEPGREASYAAAGMLEAPGGMNPDLRALAQESAQMYPEFVRELENESGLNVDLRDHGTIVLSCDGTLPDAAEPLSPQRLRSLEPEIQNPHLPKTGAGTQLPNSGLCAGYLPERSVDPRALISAALKAARNRGVDISSGTAVTALGLDGGRITGVETSRTIYNAGLVVNCAGAWAGEFAPQPLPVRPVKGQMLSVVDGPALKHVVRSQGVYLVPRSDGRLVIGSTLEDSGFNKQTDLSTLNHLFEAAGKVAPGIAQSRRNEAWAGLRPGTPDELPILGETALSGYFVATGHYRDGILLAPVTAAVMADVIGGKTPRLDLSKFAPGRFSGLVDQTPSS